MNELPAAGRPDVKLPDHAPAQRNAIVCLEADLFFAPRLNDVIRRQGGLPVIVETPDAFVDALARYFPVLALLDLASEGDWAQAITRCKLRPDTSQIPLIVFGSHVDVTTLRAARRPAPTMPGRAAS
ncbi:MAG: hypothetical protein IPM07_01350 [Anaerolineales bacterium]|nr:hypothetical protein [Anaerolineales bacterium]